MFNITDILIKHFVEELKGAYAKTYGGLHQEYGEMLEWFGCMALEIISGSDALYHNVEHTILVTLVGQEILRGKHIKEGGVSCKDWLHCIISLLCHDIGYVRGVCRRDDVARGEFATGIGEEMFKLDAGCTDASCTRYHVDRGKLFVKERFGSHKIIDVEVIQKNLELTRFPIPEKGDGVPEESFADNPFPHIVRSADLIGQLGDPRYLQKIGALFYEFEETRANEKLSYKSPGDLRSGYPKFYWSAVYPYVKESLNYLNYTQNGKGILAQLYANVFRVEHENGNNPFASNSVKGVAEMTTITEQAIMLDGSSNTCHDALTCESNNNFQQQLLQEEQEEYTFVANSEMESQSKKRRRN